MGGFQSESRWCGSARPGQTRDVFTKGGELGNLMAGIARNLEISRFAQVANGRGKIAEHHSACGLQVGQRHWSRLRQLEEKRKRRGSRSRGRRRLEPLLGFKISCKAVCLCHGLPLLPHSTIRGRLMMAFLSHASACLTERARTLSEQIGWCLAFDSIGMAFGRRADPA